MKIKQLPTGERLVKRYRLGRCFAAAWAADSTVEQLALDRERERGRETEREVKRLEQVAWHALATCPHVRTYEVGSPAGFTGSVAVWGQTDENRAAHGGVRVQEYCPTCRCSRAVNINMWSREVSPWTPDPEAIARES